MKKITTLLLLCAVIFSTAGCRMELPQINIPFISSKDTETSSATFARRTSETSVIGDFSVEGTTLREYLGDGGDVVIPDGITVIGPSAFSRTDITSVTIPDSVEIIGGAAFYECKSLTSITIPDNEHVSALRITYLCLHSRERNLARGRGLLRLHSFR